MRNRLSLLAAASVLLVPAFAHADLGEKVTTALKAGSVFAYLLVFFGGLLTSLTPCVYPLIPITLSIFGARGEVTRGRAMSLATAYVGGIGVMYTTLGVVFALAGKAFGTFMNSPWFMVPIAVVFLIMAASMFGAFEMNLPPSIHERLNRVGGAGYPGAFAMGLVSGIIAAPCTGPVLASILTYVATTRSVFFGGSLLFTYALGMGVLFFVLAATAASLPKSGAWMDSVKSVFGVVMILAALYFLRNVVGVLKHYEGNTMAFVGAHLAVIVVGASLGAIHLSWYGGMQQKLRKGLGIVLVTFGGFGVLAWVLSAAPESPALAAGRTVAWVKGEAPALAAAKSERKPMLLDFGADWCIPCKEMEKVFAKADVQSELGRFIAAKIDVTEDSDENTALKARYGADTLPTVVLLDRDGKTVHKWNRVVEPEELLSELKKVE